MYVKYGKLLKQWRFYQKQKSLKKKVPTLMCRKEILLKKNTVKDMERVFIAIEA